MDEGRTVNSMAKRRGKNKTRRRRFRGFNLWNAAESLVQANVVTQNVFGTDPLGFLVGRTTSGYFPASLRHSNLDGTQISLAELLGINASTPGDGAAQRAAAWNMAKANLIPMLMQTVGTRAGFAVAKKLTRGFRSDINKGIKMVGLQNEVKV